MNTDFKTIAEKKLCSLSDRTLCHLTSRGTAALYGILKAMKKMSGAGKIIVPAIICPSVPNAIVYSGYYPIFCDVNCHDFNANVQSINALLETEKNIRGIIAVDLYGHPSNLDALTRIAKKFNLFMIEDVAQALGGTYKDRKLGSYGDAAILSFGHTKIIDKTQAGAVLTDDERLLKMIKRMLKTLPAFTAATEQRKKLYSQVYYTLQPLLRNKSLNELYTPIPSVFKDIYLYNKSWDQLNDDAKVIDNELNCLDTYIKKRRNNAALYKKLLQHPDIIHPVYQFPGGVSWRYCVLIKRSPQAVTDYVRSQGYNISNWYPPVYGWYRTAKKQDPDFFKNSNYIGDHIVNLWTEPSTQISEIEGVSEEIKVYLNKEQTRDCS